jgi:DtxR family Mn-dependent transcriptional regulator
LGLPSEISDKTACGIEHHIDDITLKKIKNLFAFLEHKTNGCEKFAGELEEALKNE